MNIWGHENREAEVNWRGAESKQRVEHLKGKSSGGGWWFGEISKNGGKMWVYNAK